MNISELIKIIEDNKHDVKPMLRGVVYDPIYEINIDGAATQIYHLEQSTDNERFHIQAKNIMNMFKEMWYDKNSTEDEKRKQISNMIKRVNKEIIPQIEEIVSFYNYCINKKHYFNENKDGHNALESMSRAVNDKSTLCNCLKRLYPIEENNKNLKEYYLLDLLQECLDQIEADVFYTDEHKIFSYKIVTDKEKLQNHVLMNIMANINNHAFGTLAYAEMPLWDKKVQVSIEENIDNYFITIKNNGEIYKGDASKVFDYGYCHGKKGNSGIGMHSVKRNIIELGGSIEFVPTPNEKYHITYKLTIPKDGN